MKRGLALLAAVLTALLAVAAAGAKSHDTTISGAGSTFVSPLVSAWTPAVGSAFGYTLNYTAIGSGGGIAAISNRTVDFGASDAPLTTDQFNNCKGCVQIPWALSATSISYKLDGAPPHLKITGKLLAAIYLGKVTKWNDPALKKLNPGVNLPDTTITPIFRSDGSGTTYNFTDYLSRVSGEFAQKVGTSTQVNFPVGIGARGSSGVSGQLQRTNGGIIYVDVAYALRSHFSFFKVQNAAGKYQLPGLRGIAAAASSVKSVPANNSLSIVNPAKSNTLAYPICTFTYVLLPLKTAKAPALRKFIFWALTGGQKYGAKLLFVPVPKVVLVAAEKTLTKVKT